MAIELISKIAPKNDGFTGMVDASQVIAGTFGAGEFTMNGNLVLDADPTGNLHAATKQYVDNAVSGENLWDRSGTILEPHNAGDDLDMGTGEGTFADAILTDMAYGTPTYTSLRDWASITESSGLISGGVISDAGGGNINVTAGCGMAKTANTEISPALFVDFSARNGIAIANDGNRYTVYVDYDAAPQIKVTNDPTTDVDHTTKFAIGSCFYDGTTMHVLNEAGTRIYNVARRGHHRARKLRGFERATGLVTADEGTRHFSITNGMIFAGWNELSITGIDTSAPTSDNYTSWYYDGDLAGGTWVENTTNTQLDNAQYNAVATGLVNLTSNRYGVHWIFMDVDNHCQVVYGQGNYTLSQAQNAVVPSSLPPLISDFAILVARIIVREGAAEIIELATNWEDVFVAGTANNHNELAGLQGGTADEYYHLTSAEYGGNWGAKNLQTTGAITGVNVTSGADPGHTHTGASLGSIDISADTNLAATAPIILTDDTLSLDYEATDFSVVGTTLTITNSGIDHDALTNYVANKHIDHSGVSISSGTGLTGGGDITANRTLALSHLGIESLADPNADTLMGWDDTDGAIKFITIGANLSYDHATHTLSGSAGGSGSMTTVKEGGVQVGGADIVTLNFGAGFDIAEDPNTEINITLDFSEVAGHDLFTDFVANEHIDWTIDQGATNIHAGNYSNTQLNEEEVKDFAWNIGGGTQTLITVTYQDATNDVDFVVDNDLSHYDNATSAFITATLTQEEVEDFAGAMVANATGTHTGIAITYRDATGDMDFVVDHDTASNYVANEHIDWTDATGNGLKITMASDQATAIYIDGTTNDFTTLANPYVMKIYRDINFGTADPPNSQVLDFRIYMKHAGVQLAGNREAYCFSNKLINQGTVKNATASGKWYYQAGIVNELEDTGTFNSTSSGSILGLNYGGRFIIDVDNEWKDDGGTSPNNTMINRGISSELNINPTLTSGKLIVSNTAFFGSVQGTATGTSYAIGMYLDKVQGADSNYGIWDSSGADWWLDQDNHKIMFGATDTDFQLYSDGNNARIYSAGDVYITAGSGKFIDLEKPARYENASTATLLANNASVAVTFPTAFAGGVTPVVVATPPYQTSFWISGISNTGFTFNVGTTNGYNQTIMYIAMEES